MDTQETPNEYLSRRIGDLSSVAIRGSISTAIDMPYDRAYNALRACNMWHDVAKMTRGVRNSIGPSYPISDDVYSVIPWLRAI